MSTFGDLRIVASAKITGAERVESEPVFYHWPWYRHLSRLGPWALLALAVGIPRRNRDRQTMLIFVPLAIFSVLWPLLVPLLHLPNGEAADQSTLLLEALVVGVGLLWLNADTLRPCPALARSLLSLGILLLAGLVTFVSSGRTFRDPLVTIGLVYLLVLGVILLLALAIARRLTHQRYVPLPFLLWVAAGCALLPTAVTVSLSTVLQLLVSGKAINPTFLVMQAVVGLALGLCLYVVNLPYLLLMFRSAFFRPRFCAWLGVAAES